MGSGFLHRVQKNLRAVLGQLTVMRDRDVFIVATAFGIVGGIAEALRWIVTYSVFHRVTEEPASLELLWAIPLSALILLWTLSLLFVVLARLARGVSAELRATTPFLFCLLAVYSFGKVLSIGLHRVALVALALGVGTAFIRFVRDRSALFLRGARRVAIGGISAIVIIALSLPMARQIAFMNSGRGEPSASETRPNVVLITWDTVRASSTSVYGHERPTTPNLEKLAEKGIVFEHAISAAPWTLPSHASLFTGLYHHQHSADRNSPLNTSAVTLAEALGSLGYETGGFVANTYWAGSGFGLDRGFDWYDDKPPFPIQRVLTSWYMTGKVLDRYLQRIAWKEFGRITAERVDAAFLRWLDRRDEKRPFFAFLNVFDAHVPYLPPKPFGFPFSERPPLRRWNYLSDKAFSPQQLAELREAYDACIYYLDHQLQSLLSELDRRGVLQNTIVIITADHGDALGEQNPRVVGHENNVYYDVLRVPLVISWPSGVPEGIRVKTPVSLIDVPATIVDMVGGNASSLGLHGRTLSPLFRTPGNPYTPSPALSQGNPAEYHGMSMVWPMAKGPLHSLVLENRHYIVNAKGEEELFDLTADPWEHENLVDTPDGKNHLPAFRSTMKSLLEAKTLPASNSVQAIQR